jgi:hypothetical protein
MGEHDARTPVGGERDRAKEGLLGTFAEVRPDDDPAYAAHDRNLGAGAFDRRGTSGIVPSNERQIVKTERGARLAARP